MTNAKRPGRRGGDKARHAYVEHAKRRPEAIWNGLRLRDAMNRDEIRKQITLPRVKFLERPEI